MAIGISANLGGGPLFLTGDPHREYDFTFQLSKIDGVKLRAPSWTNILFSSLFLRYISGLAEQVNLPSSKFTLGQVQLSTLQIPFPKGFEISTFSVQYLEDELLSVSRWHLTWQENIRGDGGGFQFAELGKVCCQAIFAPTKKLAIEGPSAFGVGFSSIQAPITLGGEVFPYIFPVDISRSALSKAGQNISKTTVTYARIPDVSNFTRSYFGDDAQGLRVLRDTPSSINASSEGDSV